MYKCLYVYIFCKITNLRKIYHTFNMDSILKNDHLTDIPNYIYRYRTINDNLIDSLENNYLWFSKFKDFNDPFDGRVVMTKSYTIGEIMLFSIRAKKISLIEAHIEATTYYINDISGFCESMNDSLQKNKDKLKICCFSEVDDNILMWSHYADSHKGLCLEFDTKKIPDTIDAAGH